MENENLFCKIRILLSKYDKRDDEWDPNKFWTLFEAKKRRRQIGFRFVYPVAAALVLAVGYLVLPGNFTGNQHDAISSTITASKRPNIDINVKTPEMAGEGKKLVYTSTKGQITGKQRHKPGKIHKSSSVAHLYTGLARKKYKEVSTPVNKAVQESLKNNAFAGESISDWAQERDKTPTLLQMYELAKKERELRSLSVKLEDIDRYTNFRLTVNQHLLENKFNDETNLLHYRSY